MFLPAEVLGRLEQVSSGSPLLPPPHAPSLFEWCFGNISKRFSNILHTLFSFPRERLSVREGTCSQSS